MSRGDSLPSLAAVMGAKMGKCGVCSSHGTNEQDGVR